MEPEPVLVVARMYGLGIVSVIPAIFLSVLAQGVFTRALLLLQELPVFAGGLKEALFPVLFTMLGPVFIAPVVEELVKFRFVKRYAYPLNDWNEPMDGILYAAAVGLGFATLENILYFYQGGLEQLFVMRSVFSMPAHALFCAFYGFALGLAKLQPDWDSRDFVRKSLYSSMFLHAAYNLTAMYNILGAFALLCVVGSMWQKASHTIRKAQEHSPFRQKS